MNPKPRQLFSLSLIPSTPDADGRPTYTAGEPVWCDCGPLVPKHRPIEGGTYHPATTGFAFYDDDGILRLASADERFTA